MDDNINFNDLILIGKFQNKVIYYDEKSDKLFSSWQEEQSFSSNYTSFIIFYHSLVLLNDIFIIENMLMKILAFIFSTITSVYIFYNKFKKEEEIELRPFFIEFHDKDKLLKYLKKLRKRSNRMIAIIFLASLVIASILSFYWYIISYKTMIALYISSDILALTIILLSFFKKKNNNKIMKNTKIRKRVIEDMIKRTEYLISIR